MPDEPTTRCLAGAALRDAGRDGASRAALLERVFERVFRYFRHNVADAREADDGTRRALLSIERALRDGTADPGPGFHVWLWRRAHDALLATRREAPSGDPAPRSALGEIERKVGPEAFECFVLRYEGRLAAADVASVVGRDPATVDAWIHAAEEFAEARAREGHRP